MLERVKNFPFSVKCLQVVFLIALVIYFIMIYGTDLLSQSHIVAGAVFVLGNAAAAISIVRFRTGSWPLAIVNIPLATAIYIHYLFMAKGI